MKNKIITAAILLLFLIALPLQAKAQDPIAAEISFTVKNAPGTVVIQGSDNAPLPEQTEIEGAEAGSFTLTFTEPGDYRYTVYQKPGNTQGVTYDDTVYEICVSVFVDENGAFYTVTAVNAVGSTEKVDILGFENRLPQPSGKPQTGDYSQPLLWFAVMLLSLIALTGSILLGKKAK